jgi:phage shock protein A
LGNGGRCKLYRAL